MSLATWASFLETGLDALVGWISPVLPPLASFLVLSWCFFVKSSQGWIHQKPPQRLPEAGDPGRRGPAPSGARRSRRRRRGAGRSRVASAARTKERCTWRWWRRWRQRGVGGVETSGFAQQPFFCTCWVGFGRPFELNQPKRWASEEDTEVGGGGMVRQPLVVALPQCGGPDEWQRKNQGVRETSSNLQATKTNHQLSSQPAGHQN